MKNYRIGILAVLCFALAACSSAEKNMETEIAETAEAQETAAQETAAAETVHPISILAGENSFSEWDESGERLLASVSYPVVMLAEQETYPELAETLALIQKEREEACRFAYEASLENAKERLLAEPANFIANEIQETVKVRRADSRAVSLVFDGSFYLGDAEGSSYSETAVIDTRTGKQLSLSDVITDSERAQQAVCEEAAAWSDWMPDAEPSEWSDFIRESWEHVPWVLDPQGLTVYLVSYASAAEPERIQSVTLSFSQYPDLIKEEYQKVPESWGSEFSMNRHFYADTDGDGEVNDIFISAEKTEYGDYASLDICVDQASLTDELYAFSAEPMLLCDRDGKAILLIETQSANDYRMISVYDLGTGMPEKLGYAGGARCQVWNEPYECGMHQVLNNPEEFSLSTRTYLLGTYDGIRTYHMTEDGLPEAEEEWYEMTAPFPDFITFTVQKSFTADVVDEQGAAAGSTELSAGETVTYVRTDNASFADVRRSNGQIVRLAVKADWPVSVNGMPVEEVLDGVIFAG